MNYMVSEIAIIWNFILKLRNFLLLAKIKKKKKRSERGVMKWRKAIFTGEKKKFFWMNETVHQVVNWAKTWKHKLCKLHKIIGWHRAEKQHVELNISKLKVGIFVYHALQTIKFVWQVHWHQTGNLSCPIIWKVSPILGNCISCSVVCEKAIRRNYEKVQIHKLYKSRVMNKCMSYER